jgi:hypothetical protein
MSTNKFLGERVERLESALSGAMRGGDRQADELIRLSRIAVRQRRNLWRALGLLRQGRYAEAVTVLETCVRDQESPR